MKKQIDDRGGPGSPAARKKQKTVPSPEEKEEKKNRKGEAQRLRRQERQLYDEMVAKAGLLKHIKDHYREKMRDAFEKRFDSYSKSIFKASSRLMHLAREMYENVAHLETVEIPEDFFDTTFIRHLMLGTAETRRENVLVHGLYEKHPLYSFNSTPYRGDSNVYI
jgi:hypothetical protein